MIRPRLLVLALVVALSAGGIASSIARAQTAPAASAPATSAAPASSAAPSGAFSASAEATTGPEAAPTATATAVRLRQSAPKPPGPSKNQAKAYDLLMKEAKEYEGGAREYRRTLTQIVRYHYEERRRRVLAALDREIKVERQGLESARNEAIARIERFIVRYSGSNADPEATPDAMFRLAALYEERGREKSDANLAEGLEPAIALYRRIIREYPKYEEVAAVHYYLGHALTDAERLEEGQQAFRALVCANRYFVARRRPEQARSRCSRSAQDHDQKYWSEWSDTPSGTARSGGRERRAADRRLRPPVAEDETAFADPYASCEPVPQKTLAGRRTPVHRRELVAARQLSLRSDRSAGWPVQPEPGSQRLRPLDGVQEAADLRRLAVQAGLDLLQATALPDGRQGVRQSAGLRRRARGENRRPRRGFPLRGVHVHRGLADVRGLRRAAGRAPLHLTERRARHRAEPGRGGAQDGDRDHARAGPGAGSPGQEVDRRDLQGARPGVHRDHAAPERDLDARAHAPEVPDGSRRAGDAKQRLRAVRGARLGWRPTAPPPARSTRASRSRRAPELAQYVGHHALGRGEPRRPGSAGPRRAARARRREARRGGPHQLGPRLLREGRRQPTTRPSSAR